MAIPIYWISYTDKFDSKRYSQFNNKLHRLSKSLTNKFITVKTNNLDITQSHLQTIKLAIQNKETEIIVLEDTTSIDDISSFRLLTKELLTFEKIQPFILHLGGYLEEKSFKQDKNWILGKSRSTFGYWINLKNIDIKYLNTIISWSDFIYENTSGIHNPILVKPFGYDLTNKNNLMNNTLTGLSMVQISETNTSGEYNQINLKFNEDIKDLPRITLLTIVNNQRLWWPFIRFNLDNIDYPTQKMKWLIVDITDSKGYDIEDLIPPTNKRGKTTGWHLDYIKKPEWYSLEYNHILKNISNEFTNGFIGDFIVEFEPQTFYPIFSLLSRVKTMIKYPNMNSAGSVSNQLYVIKENKTYLIGDETNNKEFIKGSRITRLGKYNNDINTKIRIPNQFVSYSIVNNKKENQNNNILYTNSDRFPDVFEKEEFFTNMIVTLNDISKK